MFTISSLKLVLVVKYFAVHMTLMQNYTKKNNSIESTQV